MVQPTPPRHECLTVEFAGQAWPAQVEVLRGQDAVVRFSPPARVADTVALRLRWQDGRVTQLRARVSAISDSGDVSMDVVGVESDWQPWLEYLGARS